MLKISNTIVFILNLLLLLIIGYLSIVFIISKQALGIVIGTLILLLAIWGLFSLFKVLKDLIKLYKNELTRYDKLISSSSMLVFIGIFMIFELYTTSIYLFIFDIAVIIISAINIILTNKNNLKS